MMKPITPQEAAARLPEKSSIPDELIQAINDLILEKFDGENSFDITIDEIKERFSKQPFKNSYLNFEPYYIKSGWNVKWIKDSNAWEDGYDRYEFKPKK